MIWVDICQRNDTFWHTRTSVFGYSSVEIGYPKQPDSKKHHDTFLDKKNKKPTISSGFLHFFGLHRSMYWLPARTRINYLNIFNHFNFWIYDFLHTPKYTPKFCLSVIKIYRSQCFTSTGKKIFIHWITIKRSVFSLA